MIKVTEETFDKQILQNKKTVIAMFHATYCPFCKRFIPIFENVSEKNEYNFALVDITDDNNPLWEKYNVEAVPTIVAFNEGKEIGRRDAARGIGLTDTDLQNLISELP